MRRKREEDENTDKTKIFKMFSDLNIPSNNTVPNTYNYKKYLYHNNIEYTLSIKEYKQVSKNKNIFIKIKNYFYKRINNLLKFFLLIFFRVFV